MGHSVRKQAIPVEFFEQICANQLLLALIDQLWGCGGSMFHWFTPFTVTNSEYFPSPVDELKQDYGVMKDFWKNGFQSEDELESYCTLLEQSLNQLKADNPYLIHQEVWLDRRMHEQVYSAILQNLEVKFPDLDAEFAYEAVWGGERIQPGSDLRYLSSNRVRAIAQVLNQIEVNELLHHSDAFHGDPVSLEEFHKTVQAFKTCFKEAAEREQIILTKVT
ncbi:hypothetical protein H6F93_19080 [Leptolyngbya sp. FACHB-671]|uniref:hypothetical protein n=1 Tax=Leptolyngbya sp. FACHB-671 TaxID=2692812 RepID=UPI00168787FA|nr:hypothetical protein [Leptolyngbya sp. FACHB-671]MBD2069599.1 hypothetical protein [Leptolyngbya sp. FACHB-671]